MKDKKFQIFVSSTFTDLKEERQAAVEAILSAGHIPAGMELFSAGDESQMTVIKRWIDESDIYLLIFGGRYGSIDPATNKSYTQLEYEYAIETAKPLFAIVITDYALDLKVKAFGTSAIETENPKLLKDFKKLVQKNLVKFWEDKKDIKLAIFETISDFSYTKELVGWIRGDNQINTAFLAEELAKLTKENSELREKVNQNTHNPLYANLTFEELKEFLENQYFTAYDTEINLFEYLIVIGEKIAKKGIVISDDRIGLEKLALYKIVDQLANDGYSGRFQFTEEGHNFYLRAKMLKMKNE